MSYPCQSRNTLVFPCHALQRSAFCSKARYGTPLRWAGGSSTSVVEPLPSFLYLPQLSNFVTRHLNKVANISKEKWRVGIIATSWLALIRGTSLRLSKAATWSYVGRASGSISAHRPLRQLFAGAPDRQRQNRCWNDCP